MPLTCKAFLLLLFAILRHASLFGDDRRLYPISKIDLAHQILVLVSAHETTDDMHHRETLDEIGQGLFTDNRHYNHQLRLNISMEKRILRLEDEFWRIRTDTGELPDAERNALRAYLVEKGFNTAMIDDNLAIAGELTWQEVIEPIEGFYEGKADVYPF